MADGAYKLVIVLAVGVSNLVILQVAVIYCGVRGFLDKVDPAKITDFEAAFVEHMKGTQQPLLDSIRTDGMLSATNDASLNKVREHPLEDYLQSVHDLTLFFFQIVKEFLASWNA